MKENQAHIGIYISSHRLIN